MYQLAVENSKHHAYTTCIVSAMLLAHRSRTQHKHIFYSVSMSVAPLILAASCMHLVLDKAALQLTQNSHLAAQLPIGAVVGFLEELGQLSHRCSTAQLRGPARSVKLQVRCDL